MKKSYLFLTSVLLFTALSSFGQNKKLPVPTKAFLKESKTTENAEVVYFTKYFGKGTRKVLKRFDESKEVCSSFYTFKNGIKLKDNSCSEAGIQAQIVFPGYDKNEIVKFVEWFFKTPDNGWNKTKTLYEPIENDAGCYIEIKQLKDRIIVNYSCGC